MKNKNKYDKFARALSSVPKTEQGDLLIENKHKKLKKISPLEVTYEGMKFGLILDLYRDLQEQHSEQKKSIGHSISTFIATLKEKGYDTSNVELNALIEDINSLTIIEPNKLYTVYHLNANGYVVGSSTIISNDIVLEDSKRPDDYAKGYYKIVDGVFVLDEDLYKLMWSSV